MLRITLEVNAPGEQALGIKEAIAMDLEKYGDVKVIKVEEILPKQTSFLFSAGEYDVYG